jgi:tungstate transport system substrate-binding protein
LRRAFEFPILATAAYAQQFADWGVGPGRKQAIAAYRIGGEPLFFPNARR